MSDAPHSQQKVGRGLAWIGAASSMVGILDFVALLLMLGLWIPSKQYGIATKAVWLFPILDMATDLGLSGAVIQKDSNDPDKISSVFWMNLIMATFLFVVLVATSPLIASFSGHAVVGYMLIAYGTKLLWQNIYFIPVALMRRELRFKELSIIRIFANVAEFAGKVGFAAAGFGVWAFVLGPLCRVLVTGIGAQLRHPWRPKAVLKWRDVRDYASFGIKSSGSQILYYFYTNADYPVVGYFFGDAALGLYRMAYEIALEPVRVIANVVIDVAFPTFARLRHSTSRLTAQFLTFTRLNLITVMTYAALIFVVADDLLRVAFPNYVGAETAVRILCVVAIFRSVGYVMPPLLDGLGHPERTFRYMATAALALPVGYIAFAHVLGAHLGYLSVAVAWAVCYPIAFAVLVWMALDLIDLSPLTYLRAVMGIMLCIVASGAAGYGVRWLVRDLPIAVRMGACTATVVGLVGLLLAYTQGLSLRTARKAMHGQPEPAAAELAADAAAPTPAPPADGEAPPPA
ncbi:MAG TPA: lipopolysaccharide biosynthesis protein [Kofleriaceae bacterium]|nr:lipopolysaccharide biosynthesis protein [Kofleriaceae bacterium]